MNLAIDSSAEKLSANAVKPMSEEATQPLVVQCVASPPDQLLSYKQYSQNSARTDMVFASNPGLNRAERRWLAIGEYIGTLASTYRSN